jgi:acyl-CoA thioester hydrolase
VISRRQPIQARSSKRGRRIKRRISIRPDFHETDMMGVVHNAVYLQWFERGRLEIMEEVLPFQQALDLGIMTPVVENLCHYRRPVRFGDALVLYTTHELQLHYEGRLLFNHYLVRERGKTATAHGHTVLTLVQSPDYDLIKDWPEDVWNRYQSLR